MTYVSRKEKVFDLPEQYDSSSISLAKTETRLKKFPSVSDRRAWTLEECEKFQHFYGLVSGSESNVSKSSSFKYIPFDVLLAILMAEKDAYIQELLDRQDDRSCCGGKLYRADGFEDSDDDREALIRKDAEVVALRNKIRGLESELQDYRETLTKAVHKLEEMDAIVSENNLLKDKIKFSEETIKYLENKKKELEKELEYYRRSRKGGPDIGEKKTYFDIRSQWVGGDCEEIIRLSSERDILLQKVEDLQKELEKSKFNAAELEGLRKISATTSSSLEEMLKENELYKKKLESMKCLEKHIEELKQQAHTLTDKYKKESQKANDQLKQIKANAKELQALKEEREALQKRVNELSEYENQYHYLQNKLHQVEVIIDENETLNKKLIQLDKLELENEHLKMKIDELRYAEIQVVEDKERILYLQRAVVDQEDEIREMLRQIDELSRGYADKNEVHRMKNELEEKSRKLEQYEKQVSEIPLLESEIDDLRNKLQKCIDDFTIDKDLLERLQEELEICRRRCHELEEMVPLNSVECGFPDGKENLFKEIINQRAGPVRVPLVDKGENTDKIFSREAMSQCDPKEVRETSSEALITDERIRTLEIMEEQNQKLKAEVENLEKKLVEIDVKSMLDETKTLRDLLEDRELRVAELQLEVTDLREALGGMRDLKTKMGCLEDEIKKEKEKCGLLEKEARDHEVELKRVKELENCVRAHRNAYEFVKGLVKELEEKLSHEIIRRKQEEVMAKLLKEEANVLQQELHHRLDVEVDSLKKINITAKNLINELKLENQLLRDIKDYPDPAETKHLKDLLRKLQAEVKVLRSLSKPELQNECEALQSKVKLLLGDTDTLLDEIKTLKLALDGEKKAKDDLEKELKGLQQELSACMTAGSHILSREVSQKDEVIENLRRELEEVRRDLENTTNDSHLLRDENVRLINCYNSLKTQYKVLESELNSMVARMEELNCTMREQETRQNQHDREMSELQEKLNNHKNELTRSKALSLGLEEKVVELEETLKVRENLLQTSESELNKFKLLVDDLRNKLEEKEADESEKDNEDVYPVEETLGKIEYQLNELKIKIDECQMIEEEMTALKDKRDSLLLKTANFEMEIKKLEAELISFEELKKELEKPTSKQEQKQDESELQRKIEDQSAEIESLKLENENLQKELAKTNLKEVSKILKETIPQTTSSTLEFYTPTAMLSPHPSNLNSESDTSNITLPETNKKDVPDLENYYKAKIQKLKEANADRIKKLTVNYEREAKNRNKAYNETINTIKSSYESDIKKLVEKHKMSIMRLQNLHEDEVQELNTNYETQMEAMQTQNENVVYGLKMESEEKYKQLVEKHNREIKELEMKYEGMLKDRETKYLQEKSSAETNITQSTNDIKEVHKQTVDNLTQFYQNSILELEEKHAKEMKHCKKNNLKRIELMKNKYEDLLVEERKKYEEQLEELLAQLKKGQHVDHRENFVKEHTSNRSNTRLEFLEVLQKIINEGLEALSFEELILVHSKTCFVPENFYEDEKGEDGGGGENAEGSGDGCRHRVMMTAEREELLKRIFSLEHELVIKQLETHEAIVNMETAEKYRTQELKNALFAAQQKNVELKRLISNQTKLQADLKLDKYMLDKQASLSETNVMQIVKELEKEKAEKKCIEEELQKERTNGKHLMVSLESERERFRNQRKKDSEYLESMRVRLEEALNHEQEMESQLDYEARFRAKLESELQAFQKSFNLMTDFPPNQLTIDAKAVKDIKNFDETKKEIKHSRSKSKHRSKSKVPLKI